MVLMKPSSSDSELCISAFFKITNSYKINNNAIGGIMFLDIDYKPIFNFSVGTRKKNTITAPGSPEPFEFNSGNSLNLTTDYSNDNEDGVPYISENIEFGESVFMKVTYNKLTSSLVFFDGKKTYNSTTTYDPVYVTLFMSGEGVNSLEITQLAYRGLVDVVVPFDVDVTNKYIKIENAVDNDNSNSLNDFIVRGYSDLNECSKLCSITPGCEAFSHDSINTCTIKNKISHEFVNAYRTTVNPSPVPLNASTYLSRENIPKISKYYLFKDANSNRSSFLEISAAVGLFSLCIDNSIGENDFVALASDKINTYTGKFQYDFIRDLTNTDYFTLCMKFSIANTIFYIITKTGSVFFDQIVFVASDKTTILDPTKEIIHVSRYDIITSIGTSLPITFNLIYIVATSSVGRFALDNENSFEIYSILKNYKLGTFKVSNRVTQFPDVNVSINQHKIIIHTSPKVVFMTVIPGVLCLITPPGFLENIGVCTPTILNGGVEEVLPCRIIQKGDFFTHFTSIDTIRDILTRTDIQSTPINPLITPPLSEPIPSDFFTGWTFFYQTPEFMYVIQLLDGRIRYCVDGVMFTYTTLFTYDGNVIFTDSSGVRHMLYLDATERKLYDQISDTQEFGPFIKTFSMDLLGNSFIQTRHQSNNLQNAIERTFRFTFISFNIIDVHVYDYVTDDILYLESDTANGITRSNYKYYVRDSSYFRVDANTPHSFAISNDSPPSFIPSSLLLNITGSGISYALTTLLSIRDGFNMNFVNPVPYYGDNFNLYQTTGIEFMINELIVFKPSNSSFIEYRNVSPPDVVLPQNLISLQDGTSSANPIRRRGTYTFTNSNYNLLKTLVTLTYDDGSVQQCFYDDSAPHTFTYINSDNTHKIYYRNRYPISVKFIPSLKNIGNIRVIKNTTKTVTIRLYNSELDGSENINFIIGGVTLSNPPSRWNVGQQKEITLTINESFAEDVEYRIVILVPRQYSFFRPSTGGNFISKIQKVSTVTGVAGLLNAGYIDSKGNLARFNSPGGLELDSENNVLFVADTGNHIIRQVLLNRNANGVIIGSSVYTLCGDGTQGTLDGTGTSARFNSPGGLALDSENNVLFVADANAVRQVLLTRNANGVIIGSSVYTLSLTGTQGVTLTSPTGIAIDKVNKQLFVSYVNDNKVVRFNLTRTSGSPAPVFTGSLARVYSQFDNPRGLALDPVNGLILIADNHKIHQIVLSTDARSVIIGSINQGYVNGSGTSTRFNSPGDIALDYVNGVLYVADTNNHRIRQITLIRNLDGTLNSADLFSHTLAGDASGIMYGYPASGYADGIVENSKFLSPTSIEIDHTKGDLIISENVNNTIRLINTGTSITNIYSLGTSIRSRCVDSQTFSMRLLNAVGMTELDTLSFSLRGVSPAGIYSQQIQLNAQTSSQKYTTGDIILKTVENIDTRNIYEITINSQGVSPVTTIATTELVFRPTQTITRQFFIQPTTSSSDGRTDFITSTYGTGVADWGIDSRNFTHFKLSIGGDTHTLYITTTTNGYGYYVFFVNSDTGLKIASPITSKTGFSELKFGRLEPLNQSPSPVPTGQTSPSPVPTGQTSPSPVPTGQTSPVQSPQPYRFIDVGTIFSGVIGTDVVSDDGTGRTNKIYDSSWGSPISDWGITTVFQGYTHIKFRNFSSGVDYIFKITNRDTHNFYGYFVDSLNNKLSTNPYTSINHFGSQTYVLGIFGTEIPSSSISAQSITRNVNISVVYDDGTGRTNSISDGTLISTWGISSGFTLGESSITDPDQTDVYTHILIRTGSTNKIMYITSTDSLNIYGFFTDNLGNELASSPFTTTTQITNFSLGNLILFQ
jgi:sugar lactone lactonase YvrE